jgi:hypothetical protein
MRSGFITSFSWFDPTSDARLVVRVVWRNNPANCRLTELAFTIMKHSIDEISAYNLGPTNFGERLVNIIKTDLI